MTKYRIPVKIPRMSLGPVAEHVEATRQDVASPEPTASDAPGERTVDSQAHVSKERDERSEVEVWKKRALSLQADMEGFRRRQRRIAQEEARADHVAILRDVLTVADNLDRALNAAKGEPGMQGTQRVPDQLTEGVRMTQTALHTVLTKHGLKQIPALGQPFDPRWHEAVHVVSAQAQGVPGGSVVEVLEAGYRRHGTLFRPAKVVVAQ